MKKFHTLLLLLFLAIIGGCVYFFYYLPRTPLYSLNTIRTAVQNKDSKTVLKHIDVDSIIENALTRETADKDEIKQFIPLVKPFLAAQVRELITQEINKPNTTDEENSNNSLADIPSIADLSKVFHKQGLTLENVSSDIDEQNIAHILIQVRSDKTGQSVNLELLARQLDDGSWQIYDLPNITDIRKLKN